MLSFYKCGGLEVSLKSGSFVTLFAHFTPWHSALVQWDASLPVIVYAQHHALQ